MQISPESAARVCLLAHLSLILACYTCAVKLAAAQKEGQKRPYVIDFVKGIIIIIIIIMPL